MKSVVIILSVFSCSIWVQLTQCTTMKFRVSAREMYGALPPTNYFDPLGLADGRSFSQLQKYRESEIKHGRIAMLACIGIPVGESIGKHHALAVSQYFDSNTLTQLIYCALLILCGLIEADSILKSWESPITILKRENGLAELLPDYVPGDLRFDPLGFSPFDEEGMIEYKTKELQHGRLAMIGSVGMIAQELVDGKGILEHFQSVDTLI